MSVICIPSTKPLTSEPDPMLDVKVKAGSFVAYIFVLLSATTLIPTTFGVMVKVAGVKANPLAVKP